MMYLNPGVLEMGTNFTASNIQSQNGLAERFNGVIVSAMRTVMKQRNIPKNWWCHTLEHCTEVENMLSTKKQNNKAPYFVWTRKVPDMSKLRIYCAWCMHIQMARNYPNYHPEQSHVCVWVMHQMEKDTSCFLGLHLVTQCVVVLNSMRVSQHLASRKPEVI